MSRRYVATKLKLGVVGTRGIPGVPGGVEIHCSELYPRLVSQGIDVTVYGRRAYVPSQTWQGVRVVALRAPSSKGVEAAVHAFKAVLAAKRDGCDIVHFHAVGSGVALPLARMLGMRAIFTVHAFDYLQRKWGRAAHTYLRLGEHLGMRWADEVITVSEWQRSVLEQRYQREVHLQPNGAGAPHHVEPSSVLRSLGLERGSYVLFVGRLVPDKRVEDLIAATRHLPPEARVVIVADTSKTDEYVRSLRAAASRSEASDRIVFADRRMGDELAELYSNAQVFALPSSVEGLPIALLEALSYGIPCVASDIPANREILAGGEVGRLVPVHDVEALAAAVNGLWRDEVERSRLSQAGIERTRTAYDWDRIASETLAIVTEAAAR